MGLPSEDAVVECLLHVHTHPDAAVRQHAEQTLVACQAVKGFAPLLVSVLTADRFPLPQRQAAGLMLKKLVKENWLEDVDDEDKAKVRHGLPQAFYLPHQKLTTAAGVAVGVIAAYEYPEQWPSLIDDLVGVLASKPPVPCVAATVKCLRFIAEELKQDVLAGFASAAFPRLCEVIHSQDLPEPIRRNAIYAMDLTVQCATESCLKSKDLPASLKTGIPIAAECCVGFITQYNLPSLSVASLSYFNIVVACFPKAIEKYLVPLAQRVWASLVELGKMMHQKYAQFDAAHADPTAGDPVESGYTSDGDVIGFERLILAHLELIANFLKDSKTRAAFYTALSGAGGGVDAQVLKQFVAVILQCCYVTDDSEESFVESPSTYFQEEDEFEEGYLHSLRDTSCHVLELLLEGHKAAALGGILDACKTVLMPFASAPASVTPRTWRVPESALIVLASAIASPAAKAKLRAQVGLSAGQVLQVYAAILSAPNLAEACPFLAARCFWATAKTIYAMNPDSAEVPPAILGAVMHSLNFQEGVHDQPGAPTTHHICRLAALRAFLPVQKKVEGATPEVVAQAVRNVTLVLGRAAAVARPTAASNPLQGDLLSGYIDDIGIVVTGNKTCEVRDLPSVAIALWAKFQENPFVIESVTDLFAALAQNETSEASMRDVVPYLSREVLGNSANIAEGMIGSAITNLSHIAKTAKPDLLRLVVTEVFPVLVRLTQELHATPSIALCLRTIVSRYGGAELNVLDLGNGRTALQTAFDIVQHSLRNPATSENGLGQTGKLCLQLISGAGSQLGMGGIAGLVTALVERLVNAQTTTIVQELLFPIAALAVRGADDVAGLLAQGATPPLVPMLQKWCDHINDFWGTPHEQILLLHGLAALAGSSVVAQADAAGAKIAMAPVQGKKKAPQPLGVALALFIAVGKSFLSAKDKQRGGGGDGDLRHMLFDAGSDDDDDDFDDEEEPEDLEDDDDDDDDDDDAASSESDGDYAVAKGVVTSICGETAQVTAQVKTFLQGRMQGLGAGALPFLTEKEKAGLQKELMG